MPPRCSLLTAAFVNLLATCVTACAQSPVAAQSADSWPQWRGPDQTGVAADANPPTMWNETENVRWKTRLPGQGHSTPIIFADRIFVTAAIPIGPKLPPRPSGRPGAHDNLPIDSEYRFVVIAIDRRDGKILWEKTVHRALPLEGGHHTASLASASPVTDGQNVFAHFGTHGLYCLDFEGNVIWSKQFPPMHTKHGHGEGSSPALHGDTLLVNWDHEEQSFLLALEKSSGKQIWRRERDEVTSWSSPLIVSVNDAVQAIVCGTNRVRGYNLETGDVIWECGGLSANIVATPVSSSGVLYIGSSYEKRALMAIRIAGASGDLTDTDRVLWLRSRGTPYVPSPLLYDDALYFLTHYQNVLTRINATTGEDAPGAFRLGAIGNIYASPVAAAGHVYVTDLDGVTQVIAHAAIPRSIAVNPIGEKVSASAAIVGDEIFLRGDRHLYCIAED